MSAIKNIQSITSPKIKAMAEHLFFQRIPVTYFGKSWGNCTNNWIYFDTCIDIAQMSALFDLEEHIVVHENLDPKSGMERGFIDTQTGEAIMGQVK